MLPKKRLEMVHLQLTRNCNLRCWFCGQWGKKGFFSGSSNNELSFLEWRRVIDMLLSYRENSKTHPMVMLWGGEPLMSPYFESIVGYLKEHNFELGMVTNGVLIDKYAELCRKSFKKIYVSIDGPRKIHDKIRGDGMFDKVAENLHLIKNSKTEIIFMTVISPEVVDILPELPAIFEPLEPAAMLLQEMIFMTPNETSSYKTWLGSHFGMVVHGIDSWQMELPLDFMQRKEDAISKLLKGKYNFPVIHLPHGMSAARRFCLSPFRHLHVTWNGNVTYCTDFYDFNAGNVKESDLIDIFDNELSEKFRQEIVEGHCPTCNHCAWKNNESFYF